MYYVRLTARDTGGNQSVCSNEAASVADPDPSATLAVTKAGTGAGTVSSNPAGINCGSTCSASYTLNTSVALTATATSGSTFAGWSGACTGTGSCTVAMTAAKSVTATFNTAVGTGTTLTVSKAGTGTGTVSSNPAGINCGSTCSASYTLNTSVTLTAAPARGSTFAGWSGACTGTGSCTVAMTAAKSVTATFNAAVGTTQTLILASNGTGTGTVTSNPSGIDCGATCRASYPTNTSVTLTAAPASGSVLAGWSGACRGTGTCTVAMSQAQTVIVTFNAAPTQPPTQTATLTAAVSGAGAGKIGSNPAGINCGNGGTTCSATYPLNTNVTLTPTAASGSTFAGWSGACTGTASCTVAMTAAKSVTATFTTAATTIGFVQVAAATPQTPTQAVQVTYASAQTAGNLNVVVVGWNDTSATVQSVQDSRGNAYSLAITTSGTGIRQSIYYAPRILGGANAVTVTFSRPAVFPDIRILEYRGVGTLDKAVGASGNSATASTGPVTTTAASELIVAANTVSTTTSGAGSGFTARVITTPDGDIVEDRMVTGTGTYSATAPLSPGGNWVMQVATFK